MLVAELKANSRKGESPKEKSPGRKEPAPERPSQEPPSSAPVVAAAVAPSSTFSARAKQTYPYCVLPRYVQDPAASHLGTLGPQPSGTPGDRPRERAGRCYSFRPECGGRPGALVGVGVGDSLFLTKPTTVPRPLVCQFQHPG